MARSGPEDNLTAAKTDVNSSPYLTAGPDWVIYREQRLGHADLFYKDEVEADRFFAQASTTGPAAQILRDVMTSRDVCAKQIYMHQVRWRELCAHAHDDSAPMTRHLFLPMQLCEEGRKAHQRKQCTPTALDYYKCGTKLCVGCRT